MTASVLKTRGMGGRNVFTEWLQFRFEASHLDGRECLFRLKTDRMGERAEASALAEACNKGPRLGKTCKKWMQWIRNRVPRSDCRHYLHVGLVEATYKLAKMNGKGFTWRPYTVQLNCR